MGQIHKPTKTKKISRRKKICRQTKRKHYGGNSTPEKDGVCNTNINNLLIGEFRSNPNMLGSEPKNFANDIKNEAGRVKDVASGNWLSLPGPPPKFPTCSVM